MNIMRAIQNLSLAALLAASAACAYEGTRSWRIEECDSLRGQEQERCYAAAGKTAEEYKREREQVIKDQ